MNHFRVTYKDGGTFCTEANGTLAEFTAYLMQDGGTYTEENPVTGKETRREYAKVELIPQPGQVYEFVNYDGKPATLRIVDVTDQHIWYKWADESPAAILHAHPVTIELWNEQEYKLIA